MPKVILAYTGGLATSLCIHWLRMKKGFDVVTFTSNVGQGVNLEPIGERALELGAEAAHICDLRERFLRDFAFPALRGGAVHDSGYFLGTALTRPMIVREMVKLAAEERCEFLAHGCAGRGNDRVRFELSAAALAPHMKIIAPLEEWGLTSREEQRRYAQRYGMDFSPGPGVEGGAESAFASVDRNLWGIARPCESALSDPWAPVPEDVFRMTASPARAPDEPAEVRIGFRRGIPIRLDDRPLRPVALVEELNRLGGVHGVGRIDTVEDRLSGTKTREIYEAPAAAILFEAHRALETLVLPKGLLRCKGPLSRKYAELVYEGLWWSDLREALDAFFGRASQKVTGEVRVRLFKGRATVVGIRSPYSLYDPALARAALDESEADEVEGIRDARGYAVKVEAPRGRGLAGRAREPGAAGGLED
jgi:argininosuccinate synthase